MDHPALRAFLTVLAASAFVAGGLVARYSRPDNRTGPLMVLTGFLLLAGSLTAAGSALPFTAGQVAAPLAEAVFAHLLLAFPHGRLHSRRERAIAGLAYLDATLVQVAMLLFMDYRETPGCPCPRNLLFVVHNDSVHGSLMAVQRFAAVVVVLCVIGVLADRWRAASPPLRRSLAPVLSTGAATAVLAGAASAAAQLSADTLSTYLGLAANLALAFVPLGFLAGLLRSRLARAAVGQLVIQLGRTMAPGELRGALARALGDPSLQIAYRLPDSDSYVDLDGRRVDLPDPGNGQTVTYVEREGRPIAAVLHDAALAENAALVEAACAAAGLAMENERLQAELRARLDDLRTSRARIVQAGDSERRRLERNLHDGAQQRLVALSFELGLAEARLPADPQGAGQGDVLQREQRGGQHKRGLSRGGAQPADSASTAGSGSCDVDVATGRPSGTAFAWCGATSQPVRWLEELNELVQGRLKVARAGHARRSCLLAGNTGRGRDALRCKGRGHP